MKTVFLRALEAEDKAEALRSAIREPKRASGIRHFEVDVASFAAVPRSPFAYWVSEQLSRLFRELEPFEGGGRTAKVGVQTSDDFRFVRGWWSVPPTSTNGRWVPFTKGGTASAVYSDIRLCLAWQRDGRELKAYAETTPGTTHWSRKICSIDWYGRPGFSWALRTSRFAPSCVPAGCIFSVSRYQAFVDQGDLLATIALLNGSTSTALLRMCSERYEHPKFIVGIVQSLPIPELTDAARSALQNLAHRAWSLRRKLDSVVEVSHAYYLPALLQIDGAHLSARATEWRNNIQTTEAILSTIQEEIDDHCFDSYGIGEADRKIIAQGFGMAIAAYEVVDPEQEGDTDDDIDFDSGTDEVNLASLLLSWAVGVAFGRFDIYHATGARPLPAEPEPFDPLPVCSPGMLTGEDGLPLASAPSGYPVRFPENGVLVDDRGDASDLTAAVRQVFGEVFGATADAWWNEVGALLDPKDHDVRAWLASGFFEHHLKRYSKSRRKAPILWQLAVPSGRYSVWLYAHRLTRDSFFQIQNDVVTLKLAHEERQLASLTQNAGSTPSAKERKEIAAQESFVEELRTLLDEVKRIAPLWNPTLDDGVVLTMAPLWRLVPQHKSWQKELKSKWDELAAGKYDWAHLAMRLWPERVVPKCATDRSLAIAHGLEDVFWIEDTEGKWKQRSTPTRSVDQLVHERTSTAVKAALKSLIEAPVAGSNRTRKHKRAARTASA